MTEGTQATALTVGQLAGQFAITVRTLHHYDEIGLLTPERSAAAPATGSTPRRTSPGCSTSWSIAGSGSPSRRSRCCWRTRRACEQHLRRQRAAVQGRLDEMRELVAAIDRALEKESTGMKLTKQEQQELFGDGYSDEYAAEAEQRWGDTDAWRQSQQRTNGYSKRDWIEIKAEAEAVSGGVRGGQAGRAGRRLGGRRWTRPSSTAGTSTTGSTTCRHEVHRDLGDMYVADPRFTQIYDDQEPGLAQYVRDAIHANADRHAG